MVTLAGFIIGLAWGIIVVTAATLVTRLAPAVLRGEALGVYAALAALAGGFGSILGGWLASISYLLAFGTAGALVGGAAVLVVTVRRLSSTEPTEEAVPA